MQALDLTQTRELLAHVVELLAAANGRANAVQSLVLLPIISKAAALANEISVLQQAVREDAADGAA